MVVNEVWTMSVNKSAESQTILEATIACFITSQFQLSLKNYSLNVSTQT